MSATLHSFDSHLSSIAFSPQGHTAFALSNVFGNDWTGHITVTRAHGDVTNLPQQHGVTSAAWLGGGEAAVFGNEEGDLVCTAWASDGSGGQALQVVATATDFDAPVSCTRCERLQRCSVRWLLVCAAAFCQLLSTAIVMITGFGFIFTCAAASTL
jgi:hypothetical protein